jgi:hypothetical protein
VAEVVVSDAPEVVGLLELEPGEEVTVADDEVVTKLELSELAELADVELDPLDEVFVGLELELGEEVSVADDEVVTEPELDELVDGDCVLVAVESLDDVELDPLDEVLVGLELELELGEEVVVADHEVVTEPELDELVDGACILVAVEELAGVELDPLDEVLVGPEELAVVEVENDALPELVIEAAAELEEVIVGVEDVVDPDVMLVEDVALADVDVAKTPDVLLDNGADVEMESVGSVDVGEIEDEFDVGENVEMEVDEFEVAGTPDVLELVENANVDGATEEEVEVGENDVTELDELEVMEADVEEVDGAAEVLLVEGADVELEDRAEVGGMEDEEFVAGEEAIEVLDAVDTVEPELVDEDEVGWSVDEELEMDDVDVKIGEDEVTVEPDDEDEAVLDVLFE